MKGTVNINYQGADLRIEYKMYLGYPQTQFEPEEPGEVTIEKIFTDEEHPVNITDFMEDQFELIEEQMMADIDFNSIAEGRMGDKADYCADSILDEQEAKK